MNEYQDNDKRLKAIALERNLMLNPDETRVEKLIGIMTDNYKTVGEYICPCKQKNKPPVKGLDTVCPCPELMDEIRRDGHCHCRLFYTSETADALSTGKASSNCCGCGNK